MYLIERIDEKIEKIQSKTILSLSIAICCAVFSYGAASSFIITTICSGPLFVLLVVVFAAVVNPGRCAFHDKRETDFLSVHAAFARQIKLKTKLSSK